MNRRSFSAHSLMASLLLLSTSFFGHAAAADEDAASTQLFPDLIKVDGSGEPADAGIGDGKWTLVMMWATTCHICEIDKPLMSDLHEKHKDGNIEVFGISIEGESRMPEIQRYLDERNVSFPNSVGEFPTISSSMFSITQESLRGTPTYLLFAPDGKIKAVQAGHLDPEIVEKFVEANS